MEILLRVNYEQRVATRHDGKVISVVLSHIVVRMFMRHGEGFMHKEAGKSYPPGMDNTQRVTTKHLSRGTIGKGSNYDFPNFDAKYGW